MATVSAATAVTKPASETGSDGSGNSEAVPVSGFTIVQKNTFLHAQLSREGGSARRQRSAPPSTSSSSMSSFQSPVTTDRSTATVEEELKAPDDKAEEEEDDDWDEGEGGHRRRPCKAKRMRYRKLVDKLMEEVRKDPANFDFKALALPPSVVEDPRIVVKLKKRLTQLALDLAAEHGEGKAEPVLPVGLVQRRAPAGEGVQSNVPGAATRGTFDRKPVNCPLKMSL
mmetsp:Transcript_86956/g.210984  ORF Transcript_86956/g.210984 Transcript_86956/m.210984 type:complete len:227 (+) Transcript_86956:53-733(+)